MKLRIIVEIDGTEEQCEDVLTQLEEIRDEQQLLDLGGNCTAQLVQFVEVAAR
jgi:hypothetical protein